MQLPEGKAIVYCEGAFNTPNGKTAHGLVRFTERYQVLCVIDDRYAGKDAAEVLDGKPKGIPVVGSFAAAMEMAKKAGQTPTHFVIGLAPDGGRLPQQARATVRKALESALHVDSGLHDFISDDPTLAALAKEKGVAIRDIRKTPPRGELHFFEGKIEQVRSLKVAILGTDSAIGKRTTAWLLVHGLRAKGISAEMIGTGQTAWMQGARHSLVMDSLINDFVSGEIEHAVYSAWAEQRPQVIVIEGQGSLMNPAYPGGFEILAAGRPDIVFLQHAPTRVEYDGFPGYALHPPDKQVQAIEMLSGKPVVCITVNHEGLKNEEIPKVCQALTEQWGLPATDPLVEGPAKMVAVIEKYLEGK